MSSKPTTKPAGETPQKAAPRPLQEDDEFEDFPVEGQFARRIPLLSTPAIQLYIRGRKEGGGGGRCSRGYREDRS